MQLTGTGFGQKTGTGDAFDLRLVLHGKASNTAKTKAPTTGWAKNNAWHNVKFRKKIQRERGEGGVEVKAMRNERLRQRRQATGRQAGNSK